MLFKMSNILLSAILGVINQTFGNQTQSTRIEFNSVWQSNSEFANEYHNLSVHYRAEMNNMKAWKWPT